MIGIQLPLSRDTDNLLKMIDVLQIDSFQFFLDGSSMLVQKMGGFELRSALQMAKRNFGVKKIFVHSPYNLYLGGKTHKIRVKSLLKIKEKLKLCEELSFDGFIVHAHIPIEVDISEILEETNDVLFDFISEVPLLIENIAVREKYGSNMRKFNKLIEKIKTIIPVRVCLDTAHLFEAGYHFETKPIAYELSQEYPEIFKETFLVHLNDSKTRCGSFIDQHEEPGKGFIGLGALGAIISLFTQEVSFITETSGNNIDDYIRNVEVLKGLVNSNIRTLAGKLA
jgi:endonuclease IV